jgi:hypothetical protein
MNPIRKVAVGGVLAITALGGGALGAALLNGSASAQTDPSTTAPAATTPATTAAPADANGGSAPAAAPHGRGAKSDRDPSKGGHTANGITETVLTGDTADKVTAAALAAVPGGTIERVENDAEGATYEAHMTKADGSHVTVKLDSSFTVTSTEQGHK